MCTKFKYNGSFLCDKTEISNRFNNFFVNIGTSLAASIPRSDKSPLEYMKQNIESLFIISPISQIEIGNILSNLKDSSSGWDELRPTIMKSIKANVAIPLQHICNLSFQTGVFPTELKVANVVPIFKSGDEMVFTNYRPVSVLPVFSKVLERLMYNRLIDYINENNLLFQDQYGFQKGKSTYMALITLVDKITEALSKAIVLLEYF